MRVLFYFVCFFFIGIGNINAQDWPDWRGENRNAVWNDPDVVQKFDSDEITIKWSVDIGPGYSGPTVANGKVYITDRPDNPINQERVLCFDENNGEVIWSFSYDCEYVSIGYKAGPRASVVIDGSNAYTLGAMGNFHCFDAASGKVLWKKDMNSDYQINMPIWGIASAPLVVDDLIILHIGGNDNASVVALNKNTGKEVWRNLNDKASYSAPILIMQAGKKIVVNWSGESLSGLDAKTGEVYWEFPFEIRSQMAIATPVLYEDYIFVSSFYSGSLLIQLDENSLKAEKIWQRAGVSERKTDGLHCVMNTPVIIDDYIYGVDSYGELRCLELETGNRVWEDLTAVTKDRWANIHFVQNGENTWMFNEHGQLIISKLTSEGFQEISRTKIIEPTTKQLNRKGIGVTWSHPAFANKHVFIRSDKELVCADLSIK